MSLSETELIWACAGSVVVALLAFWSACGPAE